MYDTVYESVMRHLSPSYITPLTWMSLLERVCVLGMVCCTSLHNTLLPTSLMQHLVQPGTQASITTVLQVGSCSAAQRGMLQRYLCAAAELLGRVLLCSIKQLDEWCKKTNGITDNDQRAAEEVLAFRSRAVILLATLAINTKANTPVCVPATSIPNSSHLPLSCLVRSSRDAVASLSLPRPLMVMITKLGLNSTCE